jgi:hypothetical protein
MGFNLKKEKFMTHLNRVLFSLLLLLESTAWCAASAMMSEDVPYAFLTTTDEANVMAHIPAGSLYGEDLLNMIRLSTSSVNGSRVWIQATLSKHQLGQVWLPWHVHGDATTVEESGSTVQDLAENWPKQAKGACLSSLLYFFSLEKSGSIADIQPVFLTLGKLKGTTYWDGYNGLPSEEGKLYHMDGFHRMVGVYSRMKEDEILRAFITVPRTLVDER